MADECRCYLKCDDGKLYRVIEWGKHGCKRACIPINADGSVRWYKDQIKKT